MPRTNANRCIPLKTFVYSSTMDNHWRRCRADQQPLNVLQGRKLLANSGDAIEPTDVPLRATRALVTGASGGGGFGGRSSEGHYSSIDFRNHLCRSDHPSSEVCLEAELVIVALVKLLALKLIHDICRVGERREERRGSGGQQTLGPVSPDGGGSGDVCHDRAPVKKYTHVVGPLAAVNLGAIDQIVAAVVDMKGGINEPDGRHPVPLFLCPVGVGAVAGISSQAGRELEESAVGD